MKRLKYLIEGLVQGVGFRPFLYNLARRHCLTGWVRNNFAGVELEVQGDCRGLDNFYSELENLSPPAARIDRVAISEVPLAAGEGEFRILESESGKVGGAPLPDQGICPDCRGEFFNRADRRFSHVFNSCTVCGPRFTIMQALPFDRERTSMASFALCPNCAAEYTDPSDRRFHAQTIACPKCGPSFWFSDPQGNRLPLDPFQEAQRILKNGGILGVKGVGGYHLAVDAYNEAAIIRLRRLKGRDQRPFAVMFSGLDALKAECSLTEAEADQLLVPARPIMLLIQKQESKLAPAVNPGLREVGAFLPYTGIQLGLFSDTITALVMTSGNHSGEPLTIDDEEAIKVLGPMVDGFLLHNRPILWRCDDSVLRACRGRLIGIRRSRGFVPAPIKTGRDLQPLLACGAQQKNLFALTKGEQVFLSAHQGDLDNADAFLVYRETIERFSRLLGCEPEWAVHDLHPDYNSTVYARETKLKHFGVQHHLAHLGAVIASGQVSGPLLGVVFDGSGYGTDSAVWGGEFFLGEDCSWQRIGQLSYYPLPGGEKAIKEPWRMVAGYLKNANAKGLEEWLFRNRLADSWPVIDKAIELGLNAPLTSSMGRLFDAVAALAGNRLRAGYEGEAAIWLEQQADLGVTASYAFQIRQVGDGYQVDPVGIIEQVFQDCGRLSSGVISMKFHRSIAAIIIEMAEKVRHRTGVSQVALTGGVFQNRLLVELALADLEERGFIVFMPEIVPVNDGGIALGQAWLGSLMIERGVWDVFGGSR